MKITTLWNDLLCMFFPEYCIHCSTRLSSNEKHICNACLLKIPRTNFERIGFNRVEQLFAGRIAFVHASAFSFFVKSGVMQSVVHDMKYRDNLNAAVYFGELAGESLKGYSYMGDIDGLIAVPLHFKRERKRGYNQASAICLGISRKTGIPILEDVVVRGINNRAQSLVSGKERWHNVSCVFEVTKPELLQNKHILLVDDVITTGSTIESLAKEIEKVGTCSISIYGLCTTCSY